MLLDINNIQFDIIFMALFMIIFIFSNKQKPPTNFDSFIRNKDKSYFFIISQWIVLHVSFRYMTGNFDFIVKEGYIAMITCSAIDLIRKINFSILFQYYKIPNHILTLGEAHFYLYQNRYLQILIGILISISSVARTSLVIMMFKSFLTNSMKFERPALMIFLALTIVAIYLTTHGIRFVVITNKIYMISVLIALIFVFYNLYISYTLPSNEYVNNNFLTENTSDKYIMYISTIMPSMRAEQYHLFRICNSNEQKKYTPILSGVIIFIVGMILIAIVQSTLGIDNNANLINNQNNTIHFSKIQNQIINNILNVYYYKIAMIFILFLAFITSIDIQAILFTSYIQNDIFYKSKNKLLVSKLSILAYLIVCFMALFLKDVTDYLNLSINIYKTINIPKILQVTFSIYIAMFGGVFEAKAVGIRISNKITYYGMASGLIALFVAFYYEIYLPNVIAIISNTATVLIMSHTKKNKKNL